MTKEFVPYTLALKLKKLGFDEPCLAYYDEQGKHYPMGTVVGPNTIHFGTFLPSIQKGASALLTGSPLYSQAFKWFRDKHNLIGGIEYIAGQTPRTTWWDVYVVNHFNTDVRKMGMKYQPYEQAELACIRKLIELVKQQS